MVGQKEGNMCFDIPLNAKTRVLRANVHVTIAVSSAAQILIAAVPLPAGVG